MRKQEPTAGDAPAPMDAARRDEQFARSPAGRLSHNRPFTIFWVGQSLSNLGDAVALIAIPLLVLQATGSVARMGLVTGCSGVGLVAGGIVAGPLADRADRRRLMIACDLARLVVYGVVPLAWWLGGPQIGLIYAVAALGAFLGMCFSVTYVAAVPTLVGRDQVMDANGRLQASAALMNILGPALAGLLAARFGPVSALGVDALSFGFSALSLACIRLRPAAARSEAASRHWLGEMGEGVGFLWRQPTLRTLTFMIAGFSFLTLGAIDLFVYRMKHDLARSDGAVGLAFGVAATGAIVGSLLAAPGRRRWGFGVCYLGGAVVQGIALIGSGFAPSLVLLVPLIVVFNGCDLFKGIAAMSLRQQITPDHLLGRVTAAFWTLNSAPGPIGAAILTVLAARFGTPAVLVGVGVGYTAIVLCGLLTPARARRPETAAHPG